MLSSHKGPYVGTRMGRRHLEMLRDKHDKVVCHEGHCGKVAHFSLSLRSRQAGCDGFELVLPGTPAWAFLA